MAFSFPCSFAWVRGVSGRDTPEPALWVVRGVGAGRKDPLGVGEGPTNEDQSERCLLRSQESRLCPGELCSPAKGSPL